MEMTSEDIVIVGAGVAGLTTSLGLHRLGMRSLVLESSDKLRVSGYAFVVSANAWRALDALGIGHSLRQHHHQLLRLQLIPIGASAPIATIPFGEGKCGSREVRCVKRKSLLENLEKELPPGTIRFSSKVVSIQESNYFKLLHLADGSIIKAKVVIGCDGVNSLIAKWLGLSTLIHNKRVSVRGLAEFPYGHELQPDLFVQHYGEGIRYGYTSCDQTNVYWFLTIDSSQAKEDLKNNPANIKQFVLDKLSNVSIASKVIIDRTELDNLSMCSIKVRWPLDILSGNIHKGNVCVVGDAFHPMTPDIGQGACSAIEDAVVLARCLANALKPENNDQQGEIETDEKSYGKLVKGLEKYAKERRWRSFMIATTSYMTGKLQQDNGMVINFLREKILLRMLLTSQLKITDFDVGSLNHV